MVFRLTCHANEIIEGVVVLLRELSEVSLSRPNLQLLSVPACLQPESLYVFHRPSLQLLSVAFPQPMSTAAL